jgi:hypothetical protein
MDLSVQPARAGPGWLTESGLSEVLQGGRDEEQRGLCYDQRAVWMVRVVVTLPETLPCVSKGDVGPVDKGRSSPACWRHSQRYAIA